MLVRDVLNLLSIWRRRALNRRALAQVDARSLLDAGIDPALADFEAAQPFWRAPLILRNAQPEAPDQLPANDDEHRRPVPHGIAVAHSR